VRYPDTVVFDLDGTMCDPSARRHLVEGNHRDYDAFHARLEDDPVNRWCSELAASVSMGGYLVALVSARPKRYKAATVRHLKANDIGFDSLFLVRDDHDDTPDQELKRRWLMKYGKHRILFVVDDRPKVVRMWREEGMTCLHCADWKEKK
jgi:hypothetical protein